MGITVAELKAQVWAVVLNAGRYVETASCLEALTRSRHPLRLLVVDNASDELALARLRRAVPSLVTLPLAQNRGYAEAVNVGISRALAEGASHVWLVNNDAQVKPETLELLLAPFCAQKDCGVVGPLLLELPSSGRVQSAGVDVNRFSGRIQLRGVGAQQEELYPYPFKVDAVPGTAMLVKREVFAQAGLLEPDWYFYYEDVALCLNARQAGFSTWLHPRALVHHRGGATMGRQPARYYYGVRNQLELVRRFGAPLPLAMPMLRVVAVAGLNGIQSLREGEGLRGRAGNLGAWLRGTLDFARGRLGEGLPIRLEPESDASGGREGGG